MYVTRWSLRFGTIIGTLNGILTAFLTNVYRISILQRGQLIKVHILDNNIKLPDLHMHLYSHTSYYCNEKRDHCRVILLSWSKIYVEFVGKSSTTYLCIKPDLRVHVSILQCWFNAIIKKKSQNEASWTRDTLPSTAIN